jgi:hypothetical protein
MRLTQGAGHVSPKAATGDGYLAVPSHMVRLRGAPDAPGRPFKAARLSLCIVSVTATVPHVIALRFP